MWVGTWQLAQQAQQASDLGSLEVFLRDYGIAALPIVLLSVALKVVWSAYLSERGKNETMADRMILQQEKMLPLLQQVADVLKREGRSS